MEHDLTVSVYLQFHGCHPIVKEKINCLDSLGLLANHTCKMLADLLLSKMHQLGFLIDEILHGALPKDINTCSTDIWQLSRDPYWFSRLRFLRLRILAMYEAKTAKISNFWTFWPIRKKLLICAVFASCIASILNLRNCNLE